MMRTKILFNLILGTFCQGLFAQNTAELGVRPNYGDVTEFMRVKRYRPSDSLFVNDRFSDNLYFGAYGMLELPGIRSLSAWKHMAPGAGFIVGKSLDRYNSLRLSAAYLPGVERSGKDLMKHTRLDVNLDYLFDIHSYLAGYRPERLWGVYTVSGFGLAYTPDGVHRYMPHFQTGLHFRHHATDHLYLFAEPQLVLVPSANDRTPMRNSVFSWYPRLEFGALYQLNALSPSIPSYKNHSWMDQVYIQGGIGVNTQAALLKGNRNVAKGADAFVNLGKWYGPLGGRLGLFGQGWYNTSAARDRVYGFVGGRAELMLNLNRIFKPQTEHSRFEANGFAGWEMGVVGYRFNKSYSDRINWFNGFTFGGNLIYYVRPEVGLMLEGRYENPKYSRTAVGGEEKHFAQKNLSLALGLEIRRRDVSVEQLRKQYGNDFRPTWFTEVSGGVTEGLQTFSPSAAFSLLGGSGRWAFGRTFTPVSSLRFTVGTARLKTLNYGDAYPVLLGLDYQMNLLNILMGYNPNRKGLFDLLIGANFLHNAVHEDDAFGATLALQAGVKLGRHIELFAEPNVKIYRKEIFQGAKQLHHMRLLGDLQFGARYRFEEFNGTFTRSMRRDFLDGFFVQAGAGMNKLTPAPEVGAGGTMGVAAGKWFNFLGVRLSAFGTYTFDQREYAGVKDVKREHTQYVGGRVEGMLSLSDFWKTEEIPAVDVHLIGGWVGGVVRNNSPYNLRNVRPMQGYSFSTQVKWNVNPNVGLYIEPRFQQLFYSYDKQFSENLQAVHSFRYKSKMMELEAGIVLQGRGFKDYRRGKTDFVPENFVQADFGVHLPLKLYNRKGVDYRGGFGLGRRFTPLSAARISLDFGSYDAGIKTSVTALSADYLFSMTNWLRGYDEGKRLNLDLLAGFSYSFSGDATDSNYNSVNGIAGLKLGFRGSCALTPHWGIYVEPQNHLRFGRINRNFWMYSGKFSEAVSLNIGLEYKF